jgi:2-aminoadipate transaminase
MLEEAGLIAGRVGRGSFVTAGPAHPGGVSWPALLGAGGGSQSFAGEEIGFVMSRPSRDLFPLDDFRSSCAAVLERNELADILQLGSPSGYEPLRRHLLEEARAQALAGPADDIIVTNGCQQALDLIGRVLVRPGEAVAVEDPVYPGLKNLLLGLGARVIGIPVSAGGLDGKELERALRERPKLLVATPNFQNPTGYTMPLPARQALLQAARSAGVPVIENDPYGDLRYRGDPLPALKAIDDGRGTVLLRSFSKVSFPGLRVGWALGPKALLDRLRQAKEAADLHTDQLAQAALLEFVKSGGLNRHRLRVLGAYKERLGATIEGCRSFLPVGATWTEPDGGMNVWVRLPSPLDADEILPKAIQEGVAFLPGRHFAVSRPDPRALRLSFAGLPPEQIERGLEVLGQIVAKAMAAREAAPSPAMV